MADDGKARLCEWRYKTPDGSIYYCVAGSSKHFGSHLDYEGNSGIEWYKWKGDQQ